MDHSMDTTLEEKGVRWLFLLFSYFNVTLKSTFSFP